MKLAISILFLFCITNVCYFCNAEECTCNDDHIQHKFCKAEFVIEIKVKEITQKANALSYHVQLENVFKQKTTRMKINQIDVPHCQISCCLQKMKLGSQYVVSGKLHGNRLTLSNCHSIVIESVELTEEQISGLDGDYERNCECASECKTAQHSLCCYNRHSYCSDEGKVKRVDLSHDFGEYTMFSSGLTAAFELTPTFFGLTPLGGVTVWLEMHKLTVHEHTGTHMDSPSHLRKDRPGGRTVDEIPIDQFVGEAVVIDISERAKIDSDTSLLVEDIREWEEKYGKVKDGSIVFVYSGWDKFWGNATAFIHGGPNTQEFHFPSFSPESAEWLVKNRNLKGVGVDTMSLDIGITNTFGAHLTFLEANLYGLEMVNNLGKIPPVGAKVTALPMKTKGGSGGPTRIIAEFKEKVCKWQSIPDLHKCVIAPATACT